MTNKQKMTKEQEDFLRGEMNNKNEVQMEHIAGCEQCFNCFLFGEGKPCDQYPRKYRIKKSEFDQMLSRETSDSIIDRLNGTQKLLREKFSDPSLEIQDHEIQIVEDHLWKEDETEQKV